MTAGQLLAHPAGAVAWVADRMPRAPYTSYTSMYGNYGAAPAFDDYFEDGPPTRRTEVKSPSKSDVIQADAGRVVDIF